MFYLSTTVSNLEDGSAYLILQQFSYNGTFTTKCKIQNVQTYPSPRPQTQLKAPTRLLKDFGRKTAIMISPLFVCLNRTQVQVPPST